MGSNNLEKLVSDAEKAGYTVKRSASSVQIFKVHGGHGKIVRGLEVYEDGTAFDMTVNDLSVARGLRSYKAMRKVLELKEGK